jgi:hypothetical protein
MEAKYSVENHGLGRALKYSRCSPVNQSKLTLLIIGSPTSLQLSTNKYTKKNTELLPFKKDQNITKYL